MTAQDPATDYAAWTAPGSSFTVLYSIPLFHEIDFAVNEGYRRIPHGGLEIGGVLFGRYQADSVQIEAYRPIECEHSMGPSFLLSPRDVERLKEQLQSFGDDEELQELVPVGWFISHSRGELVVSDREAELFNHLFPRREQVTVLIKPIKFQPTRFSFLLRDAAGKLARDGTQNAIILPLPGRAGKASLAEPAPSIAAPVYQPEEPVVPVPEEIPEPAQTEAAPSPEPVPPPIVSPVLEQPAAKKEEPAPAKPAPPPAPPPQTPVPAAVESKGPARPSAAMPHTFLTGNTAPRRPVDLAPQSAPPRNRGVSILVSAFILILAVGLGFAVGYFSYSRLTISAIPLTVEDHPPVLFVSWPPDESRDADLASIRINDGVSRPLTLEEKAGGQAQITMKGDTVKVEIVTHSWFHEARGIVRYVRPAPPTPSPTEPAGANQANPAADNPAPETTDQP